MKILIVFFNKFFFLMSIAYCFKTVVVEYNKVFIDYYRRLLPYTQTHTIISWMH